MSVPGLHVTTEGRVQTWTLDHPARRNAATPAALSWIAERCGELAGEIVVLRGAGDEAFCAGFDLTALAEQDGSGEALVDAPLIAATAAMRRADATFVAALSGYAIGAGVELACACDLRIAASGAWFQVPAARLGVVYHAEGLARIRAVFGEAGVARLLLLGRRVSVEDALGLGALVEVVPPERFEPALQALVADLLAAAPQSLRGNRTLLRALGEPRLPADVLLAHEHARTAAYASADHQEARAAVAQRRPPRFTGD